MHTPADDFAYHRDREARRFHARKPKTIANVVAQLIAKRGYGRVQSIEQFAEVWQAAAGAALARFTRAGRLRRGVLEVTAGNSTILQELSFQKQQILAALQSKVPDANIRDLRFRIGAIN